MIKHVDKKAVEKAFSKAAGHYDQFAQLQRDIGHHLFNNIVHNEPKNIVDLGCGTGYFSQQLAERFQSASITCFDISEAMLSQAKKRKLAHAIYQQGDIDNLPFSENSIDLIFSNLVVQWSDNLKQCLLEIERTLNKGGRAYLSTLLDGTLNELSEAWKAVDDHPHTNDFLSLTAVDTILTTLNFSSVQIKTQTCVLHYENVIEVMRALKGIGASHVHGHQANTVRGKQLIQQLEKGYSAHTNADGQLKLTYEVCYIEVIK